MKSRMVLTVEIEHDRNIGSAAEIAEMVRLSILDDLTRPIRLSNRDVRSNMSAHVLVTVQGAEVALDSDEKPFALAENQPTLKYDYT